MSFLRSACACCRRSINPRIANIGPSASFSTSLAAQSPPPGPRPPSSAEGSTSSRQPRHTGAPLYGKPKPGGVERRHSPNYRGKRTDGANEDGIPQRPSPRAGFGQGGASRNDGSPRPPRATFGQRSTGDDTGPSQVKGGFGQNRQNRSFGRSEGREDRSGGGGFGKTRPREVGFGLGPPRDGKPIFPRRNETPLRPNAEPRSKSDDTDGLGAVDTSLPDDEAGYTRGRSAAGRGGPPGRSTEVEKSSRSYKDAEGEFTISRGKPKGGGVEGKDRGRGKDRDAMNLDRIRNERERERSKKVKEVDVKIEKKVFVPSSASVGRLADIFGVKIFNLQRTMQRLGLSEDQRRSDYLLTSEEACNIALEYGLDPTVDDERTFDIFPEPDAEGVTQPSRPPVVTIMGHVDHGKTTLLDSLRHSSVATGEAGGITQHIGAFSVPLSSLLPSSPSDSETPGTITFLDTPGHAAFTAMRARGASVTDMIVLVVAADDGVMPQTREVIELWKADQDNVGLVVAINKCDKAGIDFDKIKSALGAEGILLEEDGGDIPSVRVSGLKGQGLDKLVETLSTLAEIRELRARKEGKAEGYVLESRVDRGQGNVATILITKGTLSAGDCIVAGTTWARVRQMQDSAGRSIRSAPPGTPVSIMGWREIPHAGDQLLEATTEDEAKKAIINRKREIENRKLLADVESINIKRSAERKKVQKEEEELAKLKEEGKTEAEIQSWKRDIERGTAAAEDGEGGKKELRLVIKGDVSGSVEAVVGSLEGIGNGEAGVKIVHVGVGEVGESDVHMAEAAGASIIAFSVPTSRSTQNLARTLNVPLHSDSVIYRLIETVRSEVIKLLPPIFESRVTGEATCQQIFEIKLKGKEVVRIAGCRVGNGVIEMKEGVGIKVLRGSDRIQVYEGTIETLKHLKKDVTEVRKGTECGISFHGFTDIKEGDEIIAFTKFEVPRHL